MPQPIPAATPSTPKAIAALAAELERHCEHVVHELRALHHGLNHEDYSEAQLRLVVGRLLGDSFRGEALARAFRSAVDLLVTTPSVEQHGLDSPGTAIATMSKLLRDHDDTASQVTTDLLAIDCLAEPINGPADHERLALIQTLTRAAIDRLDHAATPPGRVADRIQS